RHDPRLTASTLLYLLFSLCVSRPTPVLPSFPTRRSSDLSEYHAEGVITSRPRMMGVQAAGSAPLVDGAPVTNPETIATAIRIGADRKSTRLNSSHVSISYAVFCLKKKKKRSNDISLTSQH